jgi:hypothetical protein
VASTRARWAAGRSSCRRWRTNFSVSTTMRRATIAGRSTASGRPWRLSTVHDATSASVREPPETE